MTSVWIVAEDVLGLAVLRRLVSECPPLSVFQERNTRGYGQMKLDIPKFMGAARHHLPVILLTDLDQRPCAPHLRAAWTSGTPEPDRFLLRIAEREVEAWLLADAAAFARHFRVSRTAIPNHPESLPDPKRALLAVVAKGPSATCGGMLPKKGSSTAIGVEYNARLTDFITSEWRPAVAAASAASLCRARYRIGWLAASV